MKKLRFAAVVVLVALCASMLGGCTVIDTIKDKISGLFGDVIGGVTEDTEYTVSFDSDGGSEVAAQTVKSGKCADAPSDPEMFGAEFAGWSLDGEQYDFSEKVTADIRLVALWNRTFTYADYAGELNEEYRPYVVLNADGTFVLGENLYVGMGEYTGSYSQVNGVITLTVKSINFSGFAGDNLKIIEFSIESETVLYLQTDICYSHAGYVFMMG